MGERTNRCPKCNGEMVQGFVVDATAGGVFVSSWVEGAPRKSFWNSTKAPVEMRVPVGTFRCSACGFLESYAQPEFDAK